MKKTETIYILYDLRYIDNEDSATVFCIEDTLKEAKQSCQDYGGAVIVKANLQGNEIVNKIIVKIVE